MMQQKSRFVTVANHMNWLIINLLGFICIQMPLLGISTEQPDIQQKIKAFHQQMNDQHKDSQLRNLSARQCQNCIEQPVRTDESLPSILVFASFSMPDSLWVSLSQELEKTGGTFILQGLPGNSFKELANKIYEVRQKGAQADIQLHPQLFQKYNIRHVPAFVVIEENQEWHQLAGNVSLDFALSQFKDQIQSPSAAVILNKLRGTMK